MMKFIELTDTDLMAQDAPKLTIPVEAVSMICRGYFSSPHTIVELNSGRRHLVAESVDEIKRKLAEAT
jgi:hypothetical protein